MSIIYYTYGKHNPMRVRDETKYMKKKKTTTKITTTIR